MPVLSTGARAGESLWSHAARSLTSSLGGLVFQVAVAGAAAYVGGRMDVSWAVGLAESMKKSENVRRVILGVGSLIATHSVLKSLSGVSKIDFGFSDDAKAKKNEYELAELRIKLLEYETRVEGERGYPDLPIAQRIKQLVDVYDRDRVVTAQEKWALEDENARLNTHVMRTAKCPPWTSLKIATFILENQGDLDAKIAALEPHAKAQVKEHLEVQKFLSLVTRAGGDEAAARALAEAARRRAGGDGAVGDGGAVGGGAL